jgi:hypothetical protein
VRIDLNAPKGLGDAIYLRAIVLHLLERGDEPTVFTRWPDVFADIPATVKRVEDVTGAEDLRHAMYCLFCRVPAVRALDQFALACLQAGILEPVALRMDWKIKNDRLVDDIRRRAGSRRILLFQPVKCANADQEALRPKQDSFARFIAGGDGFRVKVGNPAHIRAGDATPCDLDLIGKTSISDVFDVASVIDSIYCEPCFLLPLAEAMDKPVVCMFSRRGLASKVERVYNVTPERLFHKKHLATAVYDE